VLTLVEAAAFLRLDEAETLRLVREQALPARQVDNDWRFLKSAVEAWLAHSAATDRARFWQVHFGGLRDDPQLADVVREAYRRRGRPEDGEP
jgi:excisionase family DNA binding protein